MVMSAVSAGLASVGVCAAHSIFLLWTIDHRLADAHLGHHSVESLVLWKGKPRLREVQGPPKATAENGCSLTCSGSSLYPAASLLLAGKLPQSGGGAQAGPQSRVLRAMCGEWPRWLGVGGATERREGDPGTLQPTTPNCVTWASHIVSLTSFIKWGRRS